LCYFAAVSSNGQIAPPDDQPRKIRGTVINAVTQAPIPRALVVSSDNRFAMLTDPEGHFEFTVADDGEAGTQGTIVRQYVSYGGNCAFLHARKPGFLDDCTEPRSAGKFSGDDHTIALIPEALIYGRVTLPDNDRFFGTRVQLFFREVVEGLPKWVPMRVALTNSAGEFRFYELRAGQYKLLMHERGDNDPLVNTSSNSKSYGYPPVYYPNAPDFAGAGIIHLSAGESVEADVSAVRQPYYRVTIPIANSDIAAGLQVTVQAQTGPGFSLGYNVAAKRIEGLLPSGNYVVEAATYGEDCASGTVNLKVNGAAVEGPTMTLAPDGSLTLDVKETFKGTSRGGGEVFSSNGQRPFLLRGPRSYLNPRLEAVDDLELMRGRPIRPPSGPNDTSFVLQNLVPGHYYWLRLDTNRGYVASARLGDVDLFHQPFTVAAGSSAPVEIEVRDDMAEIDGTVSGLPSSAGSESQSTGQQTWIYCVPLPDSAGQFQQLIASEDGRFTQTTIAPGDYRLLAFASQQTHLPYRDPEAMKAYETKGPVVHLMAGQKVSVEVPLIANSDVPEE
jgi:hypothetical protein